MSAHPHATPTGDSQREEEHKESSVSAFDANLPVPLELLCRILSFITFRDFAFAWCSVNREFKHGWYMQNVRPVSFAPSRPGGTLADGLMEAATTRELYIKPGVYRESMRITKNILVSGMGKLGSVVIEAPGWRDALYFAGVGVDGEYVDYNVPDSGERAIVENLKFVAPNPEQTFVAHIVRGRPTLRRCEIAGGLWISGSNTKVLVTKCSIHHSRSAAIKVSDLAQPRIIHNVLSANKYAGIRISKRASPIVSHNEISKNGSYAIVVTADSSPHISDNMMTTNKVAAEGSGVVHEVGEETDGILHVASDRIEDDDDDFELPGDHVII